LLNFCPAFSARSWARSCTSGGQCHSVLTIRYIQNVKAWDIERTVEKHLPEFFQEFLQKLHGSAFLAAYLYEGIFFMHPNCILQRAQKNFSEIFSKPARIGLSRCLPLEGIFLKPSLLHRESCSSAENSPGKSGVNCNGLGPKKSLHCKGFQSRKRAPWYPRSPMAENGL
jgi:hypothetical protein